MQPVALPLFTNLVQLVAHKNANITLEQQMQLVNCLKQLTAEQIEHVTVLIIHYFIVKHKGTSLVQPVDFQPQSQQKEVKNKLKASKVPNVIKTGSAKKGFSIDLNDLPLELQSILCQYCGI